MPIQQLQNNQLKTDQNISWNGYTTLPGGILLQWMSITITQMHVEQSFDWPKAFSEAPYNVQLTMIGDTIGHDSVTSYIPFWKPTSSLTAGTFLVDMNFHQQVPEPNYAGMAVTVAVAVVAIGKA